MSVGVLGRLAKESGLINPSLWDWSSEGVLKDFEERTDSWFAPGVRWLGLEKVKISMAPEFQRSTKKLGEISIPTAAAGQPRSAGDGRSQDSTSHRHMYAAATSGPAQSRICGLLFLQQTHLY